MLQPRAIFPAVSQELGTKNFVLGAQGAQHARLRTLMRLGFSRQVAAPHVPQMIGAVRAQARAWSVGQRLEVMKTAAALAFAAYGWTMANRSLASYFSSDALQKVRQVQCPRTGAMIFAQLKGKPPLTAQSVRELLSDFP